MQPHQLLILVIELKVNSAISNPSANHFSIAETIVDGAIIIRLGF